MKKITITYELHSKINLHEPIRNKIVIVDGVCAFGSNNPQNIDTIYRGMVARNEKVELRNGIIIQQYPNWNAEQIAKQMETELKLLKQGKDFQQHMLLRYYRRTDEDVEGGQSVVV